MQKAIDQILADPDHDTASKQIKIQALLNIPILSPCRRIQLRWRPQPYRAHRLCRYLALIARRKEGERTKRLQMGGACC